MARYCASCGTQVAEDQMFCSQCGAAIAAAEPTVVDASLEPAASGQAPPPPAAGPVSPPVAPAGGQPAPAAKKSSSPFVKILLIVVLILVFLMVAGIGTCAYIGYRAKKAVTDRINLDKPGSSIEIPTPGGNITLGGPKEEAPTEIGGVPVYPGAEVTESGAQFSFGDQFQIGGQEFTTGDSVDEVVEYYKEMYGNKLNTVESQGRYQLSVNTGTEREPHMVTIGISRDAASEKTKIFMSHLGGKGAQ